MTCRELVTFLMDYLAGDLSQQEKTRFDTHLTACSQCRAYLDSYQKTVAMGKLAFQCEDEALPPEVPEDLVRAIVAALGGAQ